jgi:hypothetical protein
LHTKIREILVDPVADFQIAQNAVVDQPDCKERIAKLFNAFHEKMEIFAISFGFSGDEDAFWSTAKVVEAALACIELAKEPTNIIDFADMIFLPLVHGWATPVCDLMAIDECLPGDTPILLADRSTKTIKEIVEAGKPKLDRQRVPRSLVSKKLFCKRRHF